MQWQRRKPKKKRRKNKRKGEGGRRLKRRKWNNTTTELRKKRWLSHFLSIDVLTNIIVALKRDEQMEKMKKLALISATLDQNGVKGKDKEALFTKE